MNHRVHIKPRGRTASRPRGAVVLKVLVLLLLGVLAFVYWRSRPVMQEAGILAPRAPVQHSVTGKASFPFRNYTLHPLATFDIEARVLGTKRYRMGREAELSPLDLALGWGPMSNSEILKSIKITQSNRWYYYRYRSSPISNQIISQHSANMHMIPASDRVESDLKKIREGQVVRIKGYLVRAEAADGWRWVSSLTRSDTGAGSCEVVFVETVSI